MVFYIKEWSDGHATLMADNGTVLWTFASVEEARNVCRDWYSAHEESLEVYGDVQDPMMSTIGI